MAASVAAADILATNCRELEFPQAYFQHLVVRSSAPGTVWPLAINVDDLNAGQYLGDFRGEPRNKFAAPRRNAKTGFYKCGCKGRCSIFCVAEFVN